MSIPPGPPLNPKSYFKIPASGSDLALLCAAGAEPADRKSIEDRFGAKLPDAATHVEENEFQNGVLIATLRGWKEGNVGLITDVVVSSKERGKRTGEVLLARLKTKHPEVTKWYGNPARNTPTVDRDLNVVRTVYAIAMTLGFRELAQSLYDSLFDTKTSHDCTFKVLMAFVALAISLVGIRFFWGTGNIRRYIHRLTFTLELPGRRLLILHILILMMNALLFYFVCNTYSQILTLHSTISLRTIQLGFMCSCLLCLNAGWVYSLRDKSRTGPEPHWATNNARTSVIISLATLFCGWRGYSELVYLVVLGALLLWNSFIDLWNTKDVYILSSTLGGG